MVIINTEKCIGCGACVKDCLRRSIEVKNGRAVFYNRNCIECGHCIAVCPRQAVSIDSYGEDQTEVFSEDEYKIDPDNLLRFLKQRRSVRQFQDRKVENELLDKILEAGRYAPTARNLQEISFAVIQNEREEFHQLIWDVFEKRVREKIKSGIDLSNSERHLINIRRYRENPTAENDVFTFNAPAIIIIMGNTSIGLNDSIISYDAGLAAANMEHMINALGLGAFHCGMLNLTTDDEKLKNFIGIKENQKVVMSLVMGYPSNSLKYLRTVPRYKKPVIRK